MNNKHTALLALCLSAGVSALAQGAAFTCQGRLNSGGSPATGLYEAVVQDSAYLREHQDRMDYQAGWRGGEPIGSGPVEATCRRRNAAASGTGGSGREKATKPCSVWKPTGSTSAGCGSSPPRL